MDRLHYQKCMIDQFLRSIAAVNPSKLISENLKVENGKLFACHKVYDIVGKNVYLIGFGKAVLGMAARCERLLGKNLKQGLICAPVGMQEMLKHNPELTLIENSVVQVFEGAVNNLPDRNAEEGTNKIISLVKKLDSAVDHLIVLISGGGSALLTKTKPSITLSDLRETIRLLMEAGASIHELNIVRSKLSLVKGGGLASIAYPVQTTCFILSDVINDDVEVIASGPTAPANPSICAFSVLKKYRLINKVSENVLIETEKPIRWDIPTYNNEFIHVDNCIIGNNRLALEASKKYAEELGLRSVILSHQISGNVKRVSKFYTKLIFEILSGIHTNEHELKNDNLLQGYAFGVNSKVVEEINNLIQKQSVPICVIAGGETTVKIVGTGKGGRNQELALITSKNIYDLKLKNPDLFIKYDVSFLSAGTDGIDGPTDAAGAVGDSALIEEAKVLKLNIDEYIQNNDSYNFFKRINNGSHHIITGHTGTNVKWIEIISEVWTWNRGHAVGLCFIKYPLFCVICHVAEEFERWVERTSGRMRHGAEVVLPPGALLTKLARVTRRGAFENQFHDGS